MTPEEAMKAVESVHAALEIIDSRYKDFKFTLIDVVADNASSSHFSIVATNVDTGTCGYHRINRLH